MRRWGVVGLVVCVVLAFGWFVWPTPWDTRPLNGTLWRVHRVTSRVEVFVPDSGWLAVPRPPNPFADLARTMDSVSGRRSAP